jgi:hypothetical protein
MKLIENYALIFILFVALNNIVNSHYNQKLRFKSNEEFTILQLTDLHYGEGGEGDRNSTLLVEKLINFTKPDLVIVTGDSVSGYAWDNLNKTFYEDCWKEWTSPMIKLQVPYAYTLGNHDDQADLSRKQIIDLDCSSNFSLVENHPLSNPKYNGATNYHIPIYSSTSDDISAIMWLFDTNDESCDGLTVSWGCLEKDGVNWYDEETKKLNQTLGYIPNGLAFFHIPLPEYLSMYNWRKTYNSRYEGIACPRKNSKLFRSMLKNGNINGTFCGHDHSNDFGGYFYGIELVYGRKTGYGGYGPSNFQRGARVIKLKEIIDRNNRTNFSYRHFVVQEDLTTVDTSDISYKGIIDKVLRCHKG